jgi:hypothetical protein
MKNFTFAFTVYKPLRITQAHIEQNSKSINGLCSYRVVISINGKYESRKIEHTYTSMLCHETPLDAIAWLMALYPELNTADAEPVPSPDPVAELRKEIEAPPD